MNNRDSLQNTAFILLIVMISLVLLYFGRNFLIPLVMAVIAWSLLNALTGHFEKIPVGQRGLPRWLAMVLSITALMAALSLIYLILASQSTALQAAAPVYEHNFGRILGEATSRLGLEQLPATGQFLEKVNVGSVLGWLGGSVGNLLTTLVLVMIYTGFLFAEQKVMGRKLDAMAKSPENASRLRALSREISQQVQSYIWMKTLVSLATGLLSYLVLRWVGVDFAAVFALLIFLLNFIPNIGSIVGVLLPALLTLVQFDSMTPFLIISLGLGAVQFLIGNLVEPALMGKSLNLSSLMIILSLTFWGLMWGIPGMFLSVPIMVMFAIVCARFEGLRGIAVILSAEGSIPGEEGPLAE